MSAKRALSNAKPAPKPEALLTELRELIAGVRSQVAQTVNAGLTMLYWQVGDRIRKEVLKEKRAEYGAEIVSLLGLQLEAEFGRGFSEKSLRHMLRFAETFPEIQIVSSLLRQLSWTHFLSLIYLKDPLQRDFYAEMCRIENWSTRTLQERIQSMLYERTALSRKPEKLIEKELKSLRHTDKLTPDLVFRDPYVLDFLGLKDTYSEKDLENALLREIESFLLELGTGKKHETVEVLELEPRGIHVAEYLTDLPPRELLQQRLHEAMVRTRSRLEQQARDAYSAG